MNQPAEKFEKLFSIIIVIGIIVLKANQTMCSGLRKTCFIILLVVVFACENRKVKYSGMNDKFIGVEQVVLFENGDFYLEIDEYNTEGTYHMKGDTVHLKYKKMPSPTWPG